MLIFLPKSLRSRSFTGRILSFLCLWSAGLMPAAGADPAPIPPVPAPSLPLRISENQRFLTDQKGQPFFYQADTAWMLFLKLTEAEATEYISRRKAQGFSAIQVILTGFLGHKNREGHLPFGGAPPLQDFARPNENYFAHVDRIIAEAERQGMVLAIAPAWVGCCGEGWAGKEKDGTLKPLNRNGAEKTMAFGTWLGNRYRASKNVLWIIGGDMDPHPARDEMRALALGLKAAAPQQLITYHASSSHSSTDIWPADESWLDLSMIYTYFRGFNKAWNKDQPDVYEVSHAEFAKKPVRPFFLGESTYEGEHGDWGSALQARKQAWWCLLGGGCGHAYGSPNWHLPADWRQVLDLPGAASLKHCRALFESRPWWTLEPDIKNEVVVAGHGPLGKNDAAVCARTADQSCAIAYLPSRRTLTLDLARISGPAKQAWWFNPRSGKAASAGRFLDAKRQDFTPPEADGDWVLVVDDAAKNYPVPGKKP